MGSFVKTEFGRAKVIGVNIINKSVRVYTNEDGVKSLGVEELLEIEVYDKKAPSKEAE